MTGRDRKARLTVPALILAGARNPVTPPGVLAGGERHADDLTVEVVPGAGQFPPAGRPSFVLLHGLLMGPSLWDGVIIGATGTGGDPRDALARRVASSVRPAPRSRENARHERRHKRVAQ